MKEEHKAALEEISVLPDNNSLCWARKLPDDAFDFLKVIEEMKREGKVVNKKIAATKFNDLFDILGTPINQGMLDRHFGPKGKGCVCWKDRDYL